MNENLSIKIQNLLEQFHLYYHHGKLFLYELIYGYFFSKQKEILVFDIDQNYLKDNLN